MTMNDFIGAALQALHSLEESDEAEVAQRGHVVVCGRW
jgi:hypothetical protein